MIDLTPLDVRNKKEDFRKSVRGYDPAQVDAFLDLVAERLEALVTERREMRERLERLEDRLGHYQERERALNEALLAAQELREEARSQAERDAAVRLREAETHAEAILLEADQAIRHSQRRLKEVRAHRVQLLRAVRGVIDRFSETLEREESRLEEEPEFMEELRKKLERGTSDAGRAVPAPESGSASPAAGSGPSPSTSRGEPGDGRADDGSAGSGDEVRAEEPR